MKRNDAVKREYQIFRFSVPDSGKMHPNID